MNHPPLIRKLRIRPNQRLPRNGLSKDLHPKHVANHVLRLAVDVRMDERDVVVAGYYISKGTEPFLYALDDHGVGEGVAQVAELDIGGGGGDEETAAVADGGSAYEAAPGDRGVYYWDVGGQFGFEDGEEILGSSDSCVVVIVVVDVRIVLARIRVTFGQFGGRDSCEI